MPKSDFFAAATVSETAEVKLPNGTVAKVRGLTGAEWDAYERACTSEGPDGKSVFKNDRARLVQFGTLDESGAPLFDEGDLPKLRTMSARFIRPLFDKIAALSGVGADAGNG
ncbi:hypothetical protein [Limnoglobus roseus]|uniref:Uncharacterized protein n=1 Tax=Limnoglobus roseus TaxID=2598579 RepID=A0A5C1A7X8_9BACT|nr:hypothetical protein [Limnoglobus roseus]QEL14337.1 hypothetical protein PX52LOC_01225 [Limnoglobus roseus]